MTAPEGYGVLSFDEQGVGKTVSVIDAFDRLVDLNLTDLMVVVAPKSMVGEWANAISEFMGDRYRVEVVEGPRAERVRKVDQGRTLSPRTTKPWPPCVTNCRSACAVIPIARCLSWTSRSPSRTLRRDALTTLHPSVIGSGVRGFSVEHLRPTPPTTSWPR